MCKNRRIGGKIGEVSPDKNNRISLTKKLDMETLKEKLYVVKQNQIRMMRNRGYLLPPGETVTLDRDLFLTMFDAPKPDWSKLNNPYLPDGNSPIERPEVWLFYLLRLEMNIKENELLETVANIILQSSFYKQRGLKNYIVITNESKTISESISEKLPSDLHLSVLDWNMFRYNIPEHVRIPHHRLLSVTEREQFLKKYKKNTLPQIQTTDPVSLYYGAKPEDVFEMRRRNQVGKILMKTPIYYRRVVDIGAPTATTEEEEVEEEFDFDAQFENRLPEA